MTKKNVVWTLLLLLAAVAVPAPASSQASPPAASPADPAQEPGVAELPDGLSPSGSAIVSPPQSQASEVPADQALLGLEGDCEVGGDPLIQTGWGEATFLAVQYCGSCSEPICRGRIRGSSCGGGAHCNIFSGGFMCSTGRWECQCQLGDLP